MTPASTPSPVQGNLPIWIGGRTQAAIRRTGRLGDGWLPTQVTPEDVAASIPQIQQYAAEAGRQVPDDHFGLQINCYVVERGPAPMEKVRPYLVLRRQDVSPEALHLVGTPDQVIARLREFIDAGATKFVFGPACSTEELPTQLALQSELVLKAFHTAPAD